MKAPVFNKQKQYLRAMDQKNLEIHSQKLQNMQPIMKTSLLSNWERGPDKKRQYILEERFTQIEKDNRLLLEKIMGIMQNKNPSSSPSQVRPKSLNINRRRLDQENIVRENVKLLRRIQERKPNYAKSTFDKSWKINSKYSQNLGKGSYYINLKRQTTSLIAKNQRAHSYNNTFNEKISNHEQDCNLSVD